MYLFIHTPDILAAQPMRRQEACLGFEGHQAAIAAPRVQTANATWHTEVYLTWSQSITLPVRANPSSPFQAPSYININKYTHAYI